MKKQLLALAVAAMTTFAGMADTVAFVAGSATYSGDGSTQKITGTVANQSYTQDDIKISFVKNNSNSSNVNGAEFRWYQSDEIIVEPLNGAIVTSVSFQQVGSKYTSEEIKCGTTSLPTGSTRTWTGESADNLTFTAGKQIRFGVLEVSYKTTAPVGPARPEFVVTEGDGAYIVALTCETEGAEIYYTEDGTTPTVESTKYTAPIELYSGTTTIKAIAAKDGEVSTVASKTIEVPYMFTDLSNLTGIDEGTLNEIGKELNFVVNCNMTCVYQNGAYMYVTDGSAYMLLFGTTKTYNAGDKFTKLEGTFTYYNGLPEVKNYTLSEPTAGPAVAPMLVDVEDAPYFLTTAMLNHYLKFTGATITDNTMKVGETEVTLYDRFNIGIEDGTDLTVTGFVSYFNGLQFQPTEILNGAGEEIVAAPVFNLEDGAYTEGTEIVISCATAGATIHYAINDGEMESAAAPVVLTLTADMTVEAYATMEGMGDSETVTASYTIKAEEPIEGTSAVFDFSSADEFAKIECTPAQSYPGSSASTKVTGVEMTVNGVSVVLGKGTGTEPAIYNNGASLRVYKNNTLTFTIQPGYKITKISFVYTGASYTPTISGVTDGVWTPSEVATQAEEENNAIVLTVDSGSATGRISSMTVDFEKIETGIESVELEEGAAATYYNLQGVRVENPTTGLYIRVAGKTASKVYVK